MITEEQFLAQIKVGDAMEVFLDDNVSVTGKIHKIIQEGDNWGLILKVEFPVERAGTFIPVYREMLFGSGMVLSKE